MTNVKSKGKKKRVEQKTKGNDKQRESETEDKNGEYKQMKSLIFFKLKKTLLLSATKEK